MAMTTIAKSFGPLICCDGANIPSEICGGIALPRSLLVTTYSNVEGLGGATFTITYSESYDGWIGASPVLLGKVVTLLFYRTFSYPPGWYRWGIADETFENNTPTGICRDFLPFGYGEEVVCDPQFEAFLTFGATLSGDCGDWPTQLGVGDYFACRLAIV